VVVGDQIIYDETISGWWYNAASAVASMPAAAVTFVPHGTIAATNTQAAIEELDSETQTALSGKAPTSAGTAVGTTFTPAGGIAATNVQAAIQELDSEKQPKLSDTVQVGDNATAANNFTLVASADNGTMKLARGNAGATTQDIMTVGTAGNVEFPQTTGLILEVNSGGVSQAGLANTNNVIKFGTEVLDTYNAYNPATGIFTVPETGYYAVGFQLRYDQGTVAGEVSGSFGASLGVGIAASGRFTAIQPPSTAEWYTGYSLRKFTAGQQLSLAVYLENAGAFMLGNASSNLLQIMRVIG